MRRWFLSYNSQDVALTQALQTALKRKDSDAQIFFASESMRAGGFWKSQLAKEIEGSTAFILLIGEKLGDWQVMEYYEALDRRAKEPDYPIILILSAHRPAPGLPFARQLHLGYQRRPGIRSDHWQAPCRSVGSSAETGRALAFYAALSGP
jgi:hypothetical protein